jgi:Ni/Fe-hydrogenase subunit HybB-like protein
VLGLHFAGSLAGARALQQWLGIAGAPLAAATAVYTGYLFAQAKARDLWQSALLPPHLLVQAGLAGSAVLLPFGVAVHALAVLLSVLALVHLVFVAGEATLAHSTAHAHLAMRVMTRGAYAGFFWVGVVRVATAALSPWIGVAAAPFALVGLLAHEHAYVQAGQRVPLA